MQEVVQIKGQHKNRDMEEVLKTMPTTGECEVNIEKAVSVWDKSWSISQWREEYYLVRFYDDGDYGKVRISKLQAHELIGKLDLIDEQSSIFNSGRTWVNKSPA